MFIPAIKGQGTDEQQAYWLLKAQTMQIVGTYAQVRVRLPAKTCRAALA